MRAALSRFPASWQNLVTPKKPLSASTGAKTKAQRAFGPPPSGSAKVAHTAELDGDVEGVGGLMHRLMGLGRTYSTAVGAVLLAATVLPLMTGCTPPTDTTASQKSHVEVVVPADVTPKAPEGPSDFQVETARSYLEGVVHPDQLANITDRQQLVLLADLYRGWPIDPRAPLLRSDFHHFASTAERGPKAVKRVLDDLATLPYGYTVRPRDLRILAAPSEMAKERARALEDAFDYRPLPRDLAELSSLTDEEMSSLQSLLSKLDEAGDMFFLPYVQPDMFENVGDLDRYIDLIPLEKGESATVFLTRGLFDRRGGSIEIDQEQLIRGVKGLSDHGIRFSAIHLPAAAVLGAGTPEQQARLTKLLEVTSAPGHVKSTFELARIALRPIPDAVTKGIETIKERLGRDLLANEVVAILDAVERGTDPASLLPTSVAQWSKDNDAWVYLKDSHTIAGLPANVASISRNDLVNWISTNIEPGAQRTDSNAEYHELFAPQVRAMSSGELHKIKLVREALSTPEFVAQLSDAIRADLADDTAEAGGVVRFSPDGTLNAEMLQSIEKNDGLYAIPKDVETQAVVCTFHVHGGHSADGAKQMAGPSSGYGGTEGDRGHAWSIHQDDIVVTRISATEFNVDFYTGSGVVVDIGNFTITDGEPIK